MKPRRGLSGSFVRCGGWNKRILETFYWKLGTVLIICLLVLSCGKESQLDSEAEPRSEVVAESASEQKPGAELEEEQAERKVDEELPASREKVSEPSSAPSDAAEKQISTAVAGVAFTEKLVELLDYELTGRFWGWRPNDLLVGKFTDNVNEFQLGALEAIRYTAIKLKESLTRFGDADAYDPHLIEAVNLLMNRADQFWFPSTESQYKEALEELQAFLTNLRDGKSRFYYRTDNLLALVASYKDLLGNCHENLVKEEETDGSRVSHFRADNYFYYSQGVAHVMYEILKTVRVGFVEQLQTIDAVALMDKIVEDLERASECDPWLITNSDYDGILANHRYNLAAPVSSALHNMSTMLRY